MGPLPLLMLTTLTWADAPEPTEVGAYLSLAPGIGAMALEDPAIPLSEGSVYTVEASRFSYNWGVRGGVLLRLPQHLALGIGAHLQHDSSKSRTYWETFTLPDGSQSIVDTQKHRLRVQLEWLPGALLAKQRLFLHAIIGFGYYGEFASTQPNSTAFFSANKFADHGLGLSPGLGMFVKIWRGLSLGVHLGADLGWTFAGSDASPYHAFDLETELAWMF